MTETPLTGEWVHEVDFLHGCTPRLRAADPRTLQTLPLDHEAVAGLKGSVTNNVVILCLPITTDEDARFSCVYGQR